MLTKFPGAAVAQFQRLAHITRAEHQHFESECAEPIYVTFQDSDMRI